MRLQCPEMDLHESSPFDLAQLLGRRTLHGIRRRNIRLGLLTLCVCSIFLCGMVEPWHFHVVHSDNLF